jgi:hypothetical protein
MGQTDNDEKYTFNESARGQSAGAGLFAAGSSAAGGFA